MKQIIEASVNCYANLSWKRVSSLNRIFDHSISDWNWKPQNDRVNESVYKAFMVSQKILSLFPQHDLKRIPTQIHNVMQKHKS